MPVHQILGVDDERIADYRALTDLELRTRWEQPFGLFIAEGELVIRRALRAGYRLRSVLVDEKRLDQFADLPADATLYTASPAVLESITGFHVHRGVLASFHRRALPALMLGAEGPGLSRAALAASDVRVVIPMHNGVDSLNVATAAALAFYELSR